MSTVRKSQASIESSRWRKNVRQMCRSRCGAGGFRLTSRSCGSKRGPPAWRSAPSHPLRSFRPAAGARRPERMRCAVPGVCAPATSGALAEPAAARCRGPDAPGARSRARADARSHTGRHDSRDSALRVNRRIDRESHSIPIHAIHLPATLPISPRRGKFDQPRAVRLTSRHPNNHSNERAEL